MYQQINLYQPVFRRQRKIFSAATLLQVLGVSAVALLGFYLHASWTLGGLSSTVESLSGQFRQLEDRLGILESSGEGLDVQQEIDLLTETLRKRQALLDSFASLDIRESHAFGEFFETLARRPLPGLWLTGIRLSEDGETEIRGATLNPTLVPRYLQGMPGEPRFTALNNGSVQLTRENPEKPDVSFVLSSNAREEL